MIPSPARAKRQPMKVPEPAEVWAWLQGRWHAFVEAAKRPHVQAMWAIVLLAAVLRFSALDLVEFKVDEAAHLVRALEIVEQGRLPLVGGPSSQGPAKPPMMTYLMAVPLAFGRDPRYASAFIALLNVAAVGGTFVIARRYHGVRVAVIAALLFAVNPWAVTLSRKAFTADLLAPMAVVLYGGLCAAVVDRRPWGWTVGIVALAVMLLTTYSPAPLIFVLAAALVAYRRRVRWSYVLLGVLLALVLASPYLAYQNAHRFADVRAAVRELVSTGDDTAGRELSIAPWRHATRLNSGGGIEALGGVSAAELASELGAARPAASVLGALFVLAVPFMLWLGLRAWSHWRERQDPARYVLPALWLWVPLLLLTLWRGDVVQHYLVILYPVGFIAMGLVVDRLLAALQAQGLRRSGLSLGLTGAVWVTILAIVGLQAYSVAVIYRFVATHDTTGGHGVPLRVWLRTAEMVRREMRAAGADQVWVLGNGVDPGIADEPAALSYLLSPDVRLAFLGQGGHEALLLPAARPGMYLITRPAERAIAALEELGATEQGLVTLPDDRTAARVLVAPERPAADVLGLIPNRTLSRFDTGMNLLGWDWPAMARPGERVTFATYWAFLDVPPEARAHQHSVFNHLTLGDARVAQVDGLGLSERYWQDGLVLLQWYEIELPAELPAGEYTLLTGMYALDDMTRSRIVAGSGAPGDGPSEDGAPMDAVAIGPLSIGG